MEITSMKIWTVLVYLQCCLADDGYFWHVTDFHYDSTYDDARLSCDKKNTPANLGQFGTYWCDSPWSLVNSSVQAMANIRPQVDFLLWTGDTVLHASDDHLSYDMNAGILENTTEALKQAFQGTKVYASFGNHDYFPNNQYPPYNNELYNDTWTRWEGWIGDNSQLENFLRGGYYTVKTQYGLRIIALNTNLYYTSNKAAVNHTDPAGQFVWLNNTLTNAATNGEKVLVTSHIPPGVHGPNVVLWMYEKFNARLVSILRQHSHIITSLHFGHDHADEFKVIMDNNGQPGAPMFMAPSVTPWKYIPSAPEHNPGVRLVRYDRQTGKVKEIQQYYLDIITANKNGVDNWTQEYNTSYVYGLTELTATSLAGLADKLSNSNGNEFQNYWKHFTVSPQNLLPCDETCHASMVCVLTHLDMETFNSCKSTMISAAVPSSPMISLILIVVLITSL